jgi:hypothetical protein
MPYMSWFGIGFGSSMVGSNMIVWQSADVPGYKVTSYFSHYRATPSEVTSTTSLTIDKASSDTAGQTIAVKRLFDTKVTKEYVIQKVSCYGLDSNGFLILSQTLYPIFTFRKISLDRFIYPH